jgi:hypothetical protein
VITQIIFGALPLLIAVRNQLPRPQMRWDVWVLLNAGILTLLVGIPLVSRTPIIVGGTFVFIATLLFIYQLSSMKMPAINTQTTPHTHAGRKFYIAGLVYFLLGILMGTGLWTGWSEPLGVVGNAKEVHIHANSWGLMSLVFAGILFDYFPVWTKRSLANPKSATPIFWLMTLGAFGLVFGPWFANTYLLVPGLLMHLAASIWLLYNIIQPIRGDKQAWTPSIWHLVLSYFWILAPIAMAPFVLFEIPGLPGVAIETYAPQALIYGWVLQFGFAIVPFFFATVLAPHKEGKLGGSWFSLLFINLGGVFLWASIFAEAYRATLHGTAYLFWVLALLPITSQLLQITREGFGRLEAHTIAIESQEYLRQKDRQFLSINKNSKVFE